MHLLKLFLHFFVFIALIAFTGACSGSKSYYKKGEKLREAGLYKEAAEYYYISLQKNPNNIDAKIALKKEGQNQLDLLYKKFYAAHGMENHAEAVKNYRQAKAYENMVKPYVSLDAPPYYEVYYQESKKVYLDARYEVAKGFLEEGKFESAQPILREMVEIDASYKDAKDLLLYADVEPLYQKAILEYEAANYVKSYDILEKIEKLSSNYKELKYYKNKSIEKGRLTIAILPVRSESIHAKAARVIYAEIMGQSTGLNDPFLVLIDRENLDAIIAEQKLGMTAVMDENSVAQAGKLLGAKIVVNIRLIDYSQEYRKLNKTQEKGYLENTYRKYDKVKEHYVTEKTYSKTLYNKTSGHRAVNCKLQVSIVSSETGAVLYLNSFVLNKQDHLEYAEFDLPYSNLYPGKWISTTNSSSDMVYTSAAKKRELDKLFIEKRRALKSEDELLQSIANEIGRDLSYEIKKLKK